MIFIDHLNFDIALTKYYLSISKTKPNIDYNKMYRDLVKKKNVDFLKTFIFVPKPDDFLIKDTPLLKYYNWVIGMRNAPYTDVIEGSYVARPTSSDPRTMDVTNKSTYYKIEKGSDVNLAVHAIQKAHNNSYDVGFFMSGDTDYLPVYQALKSIGKLTIVVALKDQKIHKIKPHVDDTILLDDNFFSNCLR